ncbi:MAG TPA: NHL repeat-containing protein [Thermoanaerobaculia bacterium]|nr:NHL repeat-containing protein [Thermoanaerobaculia bacterium]
MKRDARLLGLLVVAGASALGGIIYWCFAQRSPPHGSYSAAYVLAGYWTAPDAPSGSLLEPFGVAVSQSGEVFVTDARGRVVRFDAAGRVVSEWKVAPGESSDPVAVAAAPDGSVLVADYEQDRIRRFTPTGELRGVFAGPGSGDGQLSAPSGVAVDRSGFIYVADFYNHRVQRFRPNGSFDAIIGHGGRMRAGALHYPTGVAVTRGGEVIVADAYNHQLQWFDRQGVFVRRKGRRLLGLWPLRGSSHGAFAVPTSVAVGPDGAVHVADSGNHRLLMLSSAGESVAQWRVRDATPGIYSPEHVAVSPDGTTLYATDLASNRVIVLRVASRPAGSRTPRRTAR